MKRFLAMIAVVCLCGCSASDQEMEEALAIRGRLLSSRCSFLCEITADYMENLEVFQLDCTAREDGTLEFTAVEPESIRSVAGTITGEAGTLNFDDIVLAFPLMADDQISPISGPWILIDTLRSGCITSCAREGEGLLLTIDDSYADDALTLQIRTDGDGIPVYGEISWQGRRVVSMKIENFTYL